MLNGQYSCLMERSGQQKVEGSLSFMHAFVVESVTQTRHLSFQLSHNPTSHNLWLDHRWKPKWGLKRVPSGPLVGPLWSLVSQK